MAYLWSNPYGFSFHEWESLSLWQRFKLFVWRHLFIRGYYCVFLKCRARREFLHQSLKGEDFQCRCNRLPPNGGAQCSCKSDTRCWQTGFGRYCWCKCTPDGTLSQGFDEKTHYYKGEV